jgi:hypothetical protein
VVLTKHKRSSYLGSNQGRQKSLSESGVITATLYKLVLPAQMLVYKHKYNAKQRHQYEDLINEDLNYANSNFTRGQTHTDLCTQHRPDLSLRYIFWAVLVQAKPFNFCPWNRHSIL